MNSTDSAVCGVIKKKRKKKVWKRCALLRQPQDNSLAEKIWHIAFFILKLNNKMQYFHYIHN